MPYSLTATGNAIVKQAAVPVTSFTVIGNTSVIEMATAQFITNNIRVNDRVTLVGTTSNDGDYTILYIIDETRVLVDAVLTVEPAAGNGNVNGTTYALTITDEAVVNWGTIKANTGNLVRQFPIAPNNDQYQCYVHPFTSITITNPLGGTTTWDSLNEIVVNQEGFNTSTANACVITIASADAGDLILTLGQLNGPDAVSVDNGSAWAGHAIDGTAAINLSLRFDIYASWFGGTAGQFVNSGTNAKWSTSVFNRSVLVPPGVDGVHDEIVDVVGLSDTFGLAPLGLVNNGSAYTQAQSTNFGVVLSTTPITLPGLLLSQQAFAPFQFVFGTSDFTILDPQEDYPLSTLFTTSQTAFGRKSYTFNPRFVEQNEVTGLPVPVEGAQVRIFSISTLFGEVEITGSPFITDTTGRISNSGNPVILERGVQSNNINVDNVHRIIIQDSLHDPINEFIEIVAPVNSDWILTRQRPCFEGEYTQAGP